MTILADADSEMTRPSRVDALAVDSYADLIAHEAEILRRIDSLPNGGHLFLIHPFMLFADVGVKLSARAREQLLTAQPQLTGLSETPYLALRQSASTQRYRIRLKGLFKRAQP